MNVEQNGDCERTTHSCALRSKLCSLTLGVSLSLTVVVWLSLSPFEWPGRGSARARTVGHAQLTVSLFG